MTQRDYPQQENRNLCSEIAPQTYTSKFIRECDQPPSICVVEAVAEVIETDPTDLRPLYEVIDPDALDKIFESPHQFQGGRIMFRFEGCNVTVDADRGIAVSSRIHDGE